MQPVVSVCMTTYNQDKYIASAIESVLGQSTSFPMQLVIGDDHSTDKTYDICQHFAALYSNIIFCHRNYNLGLARNLALTWQECKGKYIAMLDGDDYWCSPYKLRKQVELMERKPNLAMCFTITYLKDETGKCKQKTFPPRLSTKPELAITDVIRHNYMANCSVMYRAGLVEKLPEWMLELPYCDLALHCLHLCYGNAGYIPEVLSVYRMHSDSAFESKSLAERIGISTTTYSALAKHLPAPYSRQAQQTLVLMHFGLMVYSLLKLPLSYKAGLVSIALEELAHSWRTR